MHKKMSSFLAGAQKGLQKHFLVRLLFVLFVFISFHFTFVSTSNRDILRYSNGVKFEFLGKLRPLTDFWTHSYVLTLPTADLALSHKEWLFSPNTESGIGRQAWLSNCIFNHDAEIHGDNTTNTTVFLERGRNSQSYCIKYASLFQRLVLTVKRNHELVMEQIRLIRILLPPDISTREINRKRGLLDLGGYILSGLFGVSTHKEVQKVESHLLQLGTLIKAKCKSVITLS
jgi:hypothetical protein